FGRQALASSLEDPEGFFFRSPKSFLAADIDAVYRARFERIVELMLAHLREQAESVQGAPVTRACIGRPVHFGGGSPADQSRGDTRALALLEAAARRAGFNEVAFEFEPVAAALDFERQLDRDRLVLIVDVGGGTTDCTFARLGPERIGQDSRAGDILASSGERLGGNDVDTSLSFTGLMPAMGRGDTELSGLPVPLTPFADAADVFNVPAQNAFFRAERTIEAIRRRCAADVADKLTRLETLRQTQQTLWLTMKSEQAKVALAEADDATVTLDRLEDGLAVSVSRAQLTGAIRPLVLGIERLMLDAVRLAGVQPELIYVTGGSARSPLVQSVIRDTFPGLPVVMGDAYGSVVSGLAMQAHRLYGKR
ncbi:MAG: molecular chaperone, partial [Burkholderiaceae bacterium]|nr:molecular chaperone [Burkholderiaceae bacterium]